MEALFYGLEPHWFTRDVVYKLYTDGSRLLAVVVGRQMWNADAVRAQLGLLYLTVVGLPLVEAVAARAERHRLAAEEVAERDFAAAERQRGSRVVDLHDIRHVELSTRPSVWMEGKNSGIVTVHLRDGNRWALLVPRGQSMDGIKAGFEQLGVTVVLSRYRASSGGPHPLPGRMPSSRSLSFTWYQLAWLGWPVMLVCVGGVEGLYCGVAGWLVNSIVFPKVRHPVLRYVWTGVISVGAVLVWLVVSLRIFELAGMLR